MAPPPRPSPPAEAVRPAAAGLGLLVVFGSVPYVTAWWITGNPVFPFFNSLFRSPLWSERDFVDTRWGKGVSWDLPYRMTFQTDRFMESSPGAAGFEWLLIALPAAVFLALSRHRRGSTLVFVGVASIIVCFQGMAYLRYVFPVVAILAAAIGTALEGFAAPGRRSGLVLRGAAALAVALNILFLSAGPFVYRDFPLAAILGTREREEYLVRRMPMRRLVEAVNALNYERAPVVILADPLGAGLTADALYTNWYNRPWYIAFFTARDTREMALLLGRRGVEYLIVDAAYPIPERQLRLLETVTTRVGGLGAISIRRFHPGEAGPLAQEAEP